MYQFNILNYLIDSFITALIQIVDHSFCFGFFFIDPPHYLKYLLLYVKPLSKTLVMSSLNT